MQQVINGGVRMLHAFEVQTKELVRLGEVVIVKVQRSPELKKQCTNGLDLPVHVGWFSISDALVFTMGTLTFFRPPLTSC